jgi:mRNA-degrading endonuclease toxin of MazEF toxin-antitoxin module
VNVGDLYWVEFPAGAGRAQAGRRPAIIVQSPAASDKLPTVLLIPLTTQQDALRFPGTVLIEADAENGLKRASVALVFQLAVLDRRFLGDPLGKLSATTMQTLWAAFDEITGRTAPNPS